MTDRRHFAPLTARGGILRPEMPEKTLHQKSNFANPIKADSPVQSPKKKYFALPVGQIICRSLRHPAPIRGAYRDRHGRWTRDAMDAAGGARRTRPEADGEVVWS